MSETGVLRVVSPSDLSRADEEDKKDEQQTFEVNSVIAYVRDRWEIMRNHRESSGLEERLMRSLRTFNGEYDPQTLSAIREFGGSEVYSRIVGTKARSATALLRDIYFSNERPWDIEPTDSPEIPNDMTDAIPQLVQSEVQSAIQGGYQPTEEEITQRMRNLMDAARQAAREKAEKEAEKATKEVNDFLQEGKFYESLSEILVDVPLFPYAVMKGPVVRMAQSVSYKNRKPEVVQEPKLFWQRVSPFDFFWLPGAVSVEDSDVIERLHWTRRDLNDLIDLPGWNQGAVRNALGEFDNGHLDLQMSSDSERAEQENREQPGWNRSNIINAIEFHGTIKGSKLLEVGFTSQQVPDPLLDYAVEAWIVGRHLLKIQINPNPRKRHPYFVTSFEKVPGTPVGHALPDMLSDIGDVANAAMRNLVNNMGIASGPQVTVMTNNLSEGEDPTKLYPWKRWMMEQNEFGDKMSRPLDFYQPSSNASELLGIYNNMTEIADEVSAIPRYITGSGAPGGAGRTASGLSMLMNNASKVLQQVAHNIDHDIIQDTLQALYDLIMVADTGVDLRGDESIVVKGVARVAEKETERARQLEFLSLTANPFDLQITGLEGRAEVLRAIADDLNLGEGSAIPDKDTLRKRQEQALASQAAQAQAQAQGDGDKPSKPSEGGGGQNTNNVQPNLNMRGN